MKGLETLEKTTSNVERESIYEEQRIKEMATACSDMLNGSNVRAEAMMTTSGPQYMEEGTRGESWFCFSPPCGHRSRSQATSSDV